MEVHVIHKSQADASSDTIETVSVRDEAIVVNIGFISRVFRINEYLCASRYSHSASNR